MIRWWWMHNLPGDVVLHLLNLLVHHHLIIIQHLPNNLYQHYFHHWHRSVGPRDIEILKERFF